MNRYLKVAAVLVLLVFGAASGSVMARGGHGGGGHGGGGHFSGGHVGGGFRGGGVGVGIALGVPLYGLGYYSDPYYSYPAYAYPGTDYAYPGPAMAPSAPYVQQGYPQAAPVPQQDWYYCPNSNAYYPYVRECPGGWQRVPAQPQR